MADRIRRSMPSVIFVTILALLVSAWTTTTATAQEEDADTLLAEAAAAMAEVQSFRFEITTPRGSTTFGNNLTLLGVVGEVQRPDRFRAVATVDATVARVELTMIGIGTTIWLTDPLSAEPAFMELDLTEMDTGEGPSPVTLLNPDWLLLTAVEAIEVPTIAGQDEIDGVLTTRVNGVARLDPLRATGMSSTPVAGMAMLGEPVQVAIWIDEEGHVRQLDVYGPLLATEAPDTVRRLTFTDFDEPVDIQPPTPTAP